MGLSLALLSNNHFVQEPAAASAFAVVSDSHPEDLPDSHRLDDELIQLAVYGKSTFYLINPTSALDLLHQHESRTHVSFFELVDVVLAVNQPPIASVALVANQIQENGGVRPAAADCPRANCHPVFDHCGTDTKFAHLWIWRRRR